MIKALCIGELLWDIFPDKKVWGGAPANFIFHMSQFGAEATTYTAVGNDSLGYELTEKAKGTGIKLVENVINHPTGIVNISIDSSGVASYAFNENCAWDHIPYTNKLGELSANSDLITFGTLAQREKVSRETIMKAVRNRKPKCKVLFDINLRLNYFSKDIIESSLNEADYLKLNEEEIVIVEELFELDLNSIQQIYKLELIILTLGSEGSRIITETDSYYCPAEQCKVVDTVGAGDAFTACFISNYLRGENISESQKLASKVASYVCEHSGATIFIPNELKTLPAGDSLK